MLKISYLFLMVEIEFIYNQIKIILQCNLNDKMKDIFHKFTTKLDNKQNEIYFLYNGSIIEEELTLNEIINSEDNQKNKIQILVNDINNKDESDEIECLKPSKNIICPNCKENIRISIHDYKIKLYECKNKHLTDNIPLNQYENTQMINEKKIICENCNMSNKNDTYEKKFFRCLTCKINICPLCKTSHDKTHNIIDYEQKYFICELHNEVYNSYCKDCLKNICLICENEHIDHNTISFGRIIPNIKTLKEEIFAQREKIDQFINGIEEIINKLNSLMDNIEIYYKINENMLTNYDVKNRNFCILQNIIDIRNYNNDFYKTITKINDEKNIVNKFSYLIDIYDKMNLKDNNSNNSNNANDENIKKEENIDIKNKDINLDNNKNKNKELNLSKSDKESNYIKEEKIGNFENFDITQFKVKDSYKIKKEIKIIYKLIDGTITIIDDNNKFYLFNIINDKINNVFSVDLEFKGIHSMIQLDDGNLLMANNEIHLFKLNQKGIENIENIKIYSYKLYKLSRDKIIIYDSPNIFLYSYENNKIIDQKYSFEISELKNKSNVVLDLLNVCSPSSYLNYLFVVNENEILIFYTYSGIGNNNYINFFIFYNVNKGKKIRSINIGNKNARSAEFSLYDKNNLFACYDNKIYLIGLKEHVIKKTINIDNLERYGRALSIITLNEKFILISIDEKDGKFIRQYEFENQKKIKFKYKKQIQGKYKFIGKYNDNNLIMKSKHTFMIYG